MATLSSTPQRWKKTTMNKIKAGKLPAPWEATTKEKAQPRHSLP